MPVANSAAQHGPQPSQARSPDALSQPRVHPSTHTPPFSAAFYPALPQKVVTAPDTSATAGKFDFSGFKDGQLWVALITFLYGEHSTAQHSTALPGQSVAWTGCFACCAQLGVCSRTAGQG